MDLGRRIIHLVKFTIATPFDKCGVRQTASKVVPEPRVCTFVEPFIPRLKVVVAARGLPHIVVLIGIERCRSIQEAFKPNQVAQPVETLDSIPLPKRVCSGKLT